MKADKLEYIWDNIMNIYLKTGENYVSSVEIDDKTLTIESQDNKFRCYLTYYDKHVGLAFLFDFTIEIHNSPFSDPIITINDKNFKQINEIYENLKPLFREWKINQLI